MNNVIETFAEFWEILTGIFNDNRSKIIRLVCFGVLALGAIWAAFNYFRADMLANTEVEVYRQEQSGRRREDDASIQRIMNLANTIQSMREGGEAIARAIQNSHTKPFNIDGYNETGLESLGEIISAEPEPKPVIVEQVDEFQPPSLNIKAVMLAGKNRVAVIDMPDEKGYLIKRGQLLPDGSGGRVTKIKKDGITVRIDGREVQYELSEIDNKLKKKKSKTNSNNNKNNNNNNNKTSLSARAENFLFEGAVPENSSLAPAETETTN